MNDSTPSSDRLHIVIAGRCNSGKSALINALCGQQVAIVADHPGTTTDPVRKAIELPGAGACVIVDTAGFDDNSDILGNARMERSRSEIERADIVIAVADADDPVWSAGFIDSLRQPGRPVIAVMAKSDLDTTTSRLDTLAKACQCRVIAVSSLSGKGIDSLIEAIAEAAKTDRPTITGNLVSPGDTVVLVMPQDPQAPRGRLILPQVQTLRELLDKGCTAICTSPDRLSSTLASLTQSPSLVITDSQVFGAVAAAVSPDSPLTSFSVLMAGYKGDIDLFVRGAEAITSLGSGSRVLIAEACSHKPMAEDIGRVKIPRLLHKLAGDGISIDITGGSDFPADLTPYDLVIHCGGCMFTRRHVLTRVSRAEAAGVPVTNYGIFLATVAGIMPRVVWPSTSRPNIN